MMEAQQKAYKELITCFTQSPILRYFYVNEDVIVSVDASSEGLGACSLQENQPVAYTACIKITKQHRAKLCSNRQRNVSYCLWHQQISPIHLWKNIYGRK